MKHRVARRVFAALLLLYCAYLVLDIWTYRNKPPRRLSKTDDVEQVQRFWDFHACYYCGRAYRDGVIPYFKVLRWPSTHAQLEIYTFLYQPILLWHFAALSFVEYETAYTLYLFFSAVAVAGLIFLWKRVFAPNDTGLLLYLLCLFGFNSALYCGFEAGNINTFDIALLWLAFYMFIRDRPLPFIVLIVVVSLGKLFPILLLSLLFLREKRKWRYVLYAALVVLVVHGLTYAMHPTAFLAYVRQKVALLVRPIETEGAIMPSTMHMLKHNLLRLAAKHTIDFGAASILCIGAYLGIALSVLLVSVGALRTLTVKGEERRTIVVLMASFVYALVLPHFRDYSYALLIGPTYLVITRQRVVSPTALLAGIVAVPYLCAKLPGLQSVGAVLVPYAVVFITYGLWIIFLIMISSGDDRSVIWPWSTMAGGTVESRSRAASLPEGR